MIFGKQALPKNRGACVDSQIWQMKNMDRDANVLSWRLFFNWRYTHADGVGEVRVQEVEDLDSSFVHVQPPSGIRWRRGYGWDMLDYLEHGEERTSLVILFLLSRKPGSCSKCTDKDQIL